MYSIYIGTDSAKVLLTLIEDKEFEIRPNKESTTWKDHCPCIRMQAPPCKNSNCQCEERMCENRIIFTKPGKYIATAILLDPIVTSCNLRFSFFVKVKLLDPFYLNSRVILK